MTYRASTDRAFRESLDSDSLAGPYQRDASWAFVRHGAVSFPRARSTWGTRGPRSLVATCLRVLADNIAGASADTLCSLPEHLKWRLWRELAPRPMPLHAWELLSHDLLRTQIRKVADTALEKQRECEVVPSGCPSSEMGVGRGTGQAEEITVPMAVYRYCQEIVDPPCPLSVYTSPLRKLSGCLVRLCIDSVARFDAHELLSLACMPGLAVLELIERDPSTSAVNDRLIRGWSEVGQEVFPDLRVLRITPVLDGVSLNSLQYVLKFPKLEIFDVPHLSPFWNWEKARRAAAKYGWTVRESRDSLFTSYAEAYLDGKVAVHTAGIERLKGFYDNDRQLVAFAGHPRDQSSKPSVEENAGELEAPRGATKQTACEGPTQNDEPEFIADLCQAANATGRSCPSPLPGTCKADGSACFDQDWCGLLRGVDPLPAVVVNQQWQSNSHQSGMPGYGDFWFLALLDWREDQYQAHNTRAHKVKAHVEGITIPSSRFVSLRLCGSSSIAEDQRRQGVDRLIFSRTSRSRDEEAEPEPYGDIAASDGLSKRDLVLPPQAQPTRAREARMGSDLKPRKRQKVGDLLTSLGVPQAKPG